jgi:hypothetical protein
MPLGSAMQSFFASIRNLITAIFVGAPEGVDVSKYTFQVTALISLYICLIIAFVSILFIRRVKRGPSIPVERKTVLSLISYSIILSSVGVALYIACILSSNG